MCLMLILVNVRVCVCVSDDMYIWMATSALRKLYRILYALSNDYDADIARMWMSAKRGHLQEYVF